MLKLRKTFIDTCYDSYNIIRLDGIATCILNVMALSETSLKYMVCNLQYGKFYVSGMLVIIFSICFI